MMIKSEEERKSLREGGRRLAGILHVLSTMVVPGVTGQELEDEARRLIEEAGGTPAFLNYKPHGAKRPYPAALCLSINDAIVHGIPNERPVTIEEGDVVTLDTGLIYDGLITDAAVTVIAGKGSDEDKRLIRCVKEALDSGIAAARVGNKVGDIGAAIEEVGKEYGFGSPRELGGHSVGRHVHEEPFIPNFGPAGTGPDLEAGMVIAIEPMFMHGSGKVKLDSDGYTYRTKEGSKSAHIEHTIIIGEHGAEVLTK